MFFPLLLCAIKAADSFENIPLFNKCPIYKMPIMTIDDTKEFAQNLNDTKIKFKQYLTLYGDEDYDDTLQIIRRDNERAKAKKILADISVKLAKKMMPKAPFCKHGDGYIEILGYKIFLGNINYVTDVGWYWSQCRACCKKIEKEVGGLTKNKQALREIISEYTQYYPWIKYNNLANDQQLLEQMNFYREFFIKKFFYYINLELGEACFYLKTAAIIGLYYSEQKYLQASVYLEEVKAIQKMAEEEMKQANIQRIERWWVTLDVIKPIG